MHETISWNQSGIYENQLIDLPTLVRKLKYMKGMTIQYFFGTEKAVSLLKQVK